MKRKEKQTLVVGNPVSESRGKRPEKLSSCWAVSGVRGRSEDSKPTRFLVCACVFGGGTGCSGELPEWPAHQRA